MRAAEPSTRAYYAKFLLLPAALAAAIGLSDTGKQSEKKFQQCLSLVNSWNKMSKKLKS
jgi:hypothetical protein